MRKEYDFSKAKRAADIPHLAKLQGDVRGKRRITIMLDDDVIEHFRAKAEAEGIGYQTAINAALRSSLKEGTGKAKEERPLTVAVLRKVLREELHAT